MGGTSIPAGFPDVQGNVPVVRFEIEEAYKYMVQILGRKERIPQRFSELKEGVMELLMCLKLRYGEGHSEDIASLLAWQLSICKDDEEIWGNWRGKFAKRREAMRWVQNPNLQQQILDWNDGFQNGRGDVPAIVAATKCTPLFVSDNELESCVDNGNGSRVARDLAEVTGGGGGRLLQKISGGSEVIPWEPHGIRVSLDSTDSLPEDPSKQSLVKLTRVLRISSTPARKTSEFLDSISNLDPVKYSPPDPNPLPKMSPILEKHATYSSFSNLNPFYDERYTQIGDFYNVNMSNLKPPVPIKHGHKSPRMPHSQSENNIDFRAPPTNVHNLRVGKVFAVRGDNTTRSSEESGESSFSRGRSVSRTPSPVKFLEDIKEDQSPESAFPPPKRSRSPMKQLFGEGGWLGKSTSMREAPDEEYRKKGIKHWGGKLKQRVEDLTGDVSKFVPTTVYHHRSPSKSSPTKSKFTVSLSPPAQAKLYAEVELMICATANQYLNVQQGEGRMSVESLTKVTQWWASKNRPQVIEFMFDQATQRDLVLYNIKTFRFYGPNADNILSMNTMMQSWKALAKEMSIRTFCTPDLVIKKQMHDTYKILEMLGAPLVTFLAFQEIQVKALALMEEEKKKRDEYSAIKFGVEKKWQPPARSSKEIKEMEMENPFA